MSGRFPTRVVAWAVAVVLIALPVVGVLQGWFAVDRWPIRNLQVQAEYKHVSAAQIRAAVLPYVGRGFFATDLGSIQRAVATLPWVQSVEARKRWPDTLVLQVRERQPFAHWDGARLIGRDGQVFSVPGAADVSGLPQLSGPDTRMADVIDFFVHARRVLGADNLQVTGVHLSGRDSWKLDLAGGAELRVGHTRPQQRLQRFLSVYPRLAAGRTESFTYADLRYPNGFAMRWPSPAAVAPGGAPST